MSRPRQFWIAKDEGDEEPLSAYEVVRKPNDEYAHKFIHVIEKSAYDKAIGALKGFNKYCITPECKCWACDVLKELGEL